MASKKSLEFNTINPYDMGVSMMHEYLRRIARKANDRLLRLEKRKKTDESWAYKKVMQELRAKNRRRFSYAATNEKEMLKEIQMIESFLSQQTSTLGGIAQLQKTAYGKLRMKMLDRTGVDMQEIGIDVKDFYSFINSRAGKDLIDEYGSDAVFDDMIRAMFRYRSEKKYTFTNLLDEYKEFQKQRDISFEALELKRRGAIGSYEQYRNLRKIIRGE